MRELTLDQMGKEISAAIQTLTLAQRKAIGELLLSELRKPVGTLRGEEAHERAKDGTDRDAGGNNPAAPRG